MWPHEPQLRGSVATFAHDPGHDTVFAGHWQIPLPHAMPLAQSNPHAPQLAVSLARFTHAPPHGTCPLGHTHAPLLHVPPVQLRPHSPQLFGSESTLTHPPAHSAWPVAHGFTHVPELQVKPWGQSWPQVPQLCVSIERFTHSPFGHITPGFGQLQIPEAHAPALPHE